MTARLQPTRRVVKRWVLWVTSPNEPLGAWPDPGDGGGGQEFQGPARTVSRAVVEGALEGFAGYLTTVAPILPVGVSAAGPDAGSNGSRATAALVLGPVLADCGVLRKRL